ncbi:MAG: S-adenosylmethionine decarboxylase [Flavobacteriales bacterium]|nr:S-adenosylmethionine decarboxylase [Flavobacteriales bacterium]
MCIPQYAEKFDCIAIRIYTCKKTNPPVYKPGLHLLIDFQADSAILSDMEGYRQHINGLIREYQLQPLGDVYHSFEGAGFTAITCLTESHVSIHTWPEYNRATFDVFLSNYMRVNDQTAQAICDKVLAFFRANVIQKTEVKR